MRYLYLLLLSALLSAPLTSQAQLSGSDSLRLRLNTIFAPLNKSQVPTPYLEDYGEQLLYYHSQHLNGMRYACLTKSGKPC